MADSRCARRFSGFTLTELMIVLVIIGVLVTLAVNQFYGPREQALEREAVANLKLIAAAEKIYRMEIGGYVNAADTSTINTQLNLMLPEASPKWAYKVQGAAASTFTAKATKTPESSGKASICIDQSVEEPYKTGCTW